MKERKSILIFFGYCLLLQQIKITCGTLDNVLINVEYEIMLDLDILCAKYYLRMNHNFPIRFIIDLTKKITTKLLINYHATK